MRRRLPALTSVVLSLRAWPPLLRDSEKVPKSPVAPRDLDRLRSLPMRAVRAIVIAGISFFAAGCDNVCDEVAEEAEASGCAQGLPEDDDQGVTEAQSECSGQREQYAECLLDFTDNVCFISAEEAQSVEACMNGGES